MWDASTGERVGTVATEAAVTDLVFTRDGTRLAVATFGQTLSTRIWDWQRNEELLTLTGGGVRVALSPHGTLLAACGRSRGSPT